MARQADHDHQWQECSRERATLPGKKKGGVRFPQIQWLTYIVIIMGFADRPVRRTLCPINSAALHPHHPGHDGLMQPARGGPGQHGNRLVAQAGYNAHSPGFQGSYTGLHHRFRFHHRHF